MKIITLKAAIDDIDSLVEIRSILLSNTGEHYSAETAQEELQWRSSYKDWLANNINNPSNSVLILVAKDQYQEKLVGGVIGIIDNRVPIIGALNGMVGWVQTMVVLPEYRKSGVAKQMMSDLLNWFKDASVEKITLQTTEIARSFYYSCGFIDSGEKLLIKQLAGDEQ